MGEKHKGKKVFIPLNASNKEIEDLVDTLMGLEDERKAKKTERKQNKSKRIKTSV